MKFLTVLGVALILLGLAGLVYPAFTTTETKDVAKLGDLKLQTKEQQVHVIPSAVSVGALALGVLLTAAGVLKSR